MTKKHVPTFDLTSIPKFFQDMVAARDTGSDLTLAILLTSIVDASLASLLAKRLIKGGTSAALLNSSSGALGSFKTRADLAYCIGIISKDERRRFQVMAEIRNKFAHSFDGSLSFHHAELVEYCDQLRMGISMRYAVRDGKTVTIDPESPRDAFFVFSFVAVWRLLERAGKIKPVEPVSIPDFQ